MSTTAILHIASPSGAPAALWWGTGSDECAVLAGESVAADVQSWLAEAILNFRAVRILDEMPDEIVDRGDWKVIDVGGDPAGELRTRAVAWMREMHGDQATVRLGTPLERTRYAFAAERAGALAQAANESSVSPWRARANDRISLRVRAFTDSRDDRLTVVVGSHEPAKDSELALPYALALLGERELRLVLPAGTEWPTLARVPWLDADIRVFVHDDDDPVSVREVPIPQRAAALATHDDALVTHIHDLGHRADLVSELVEWADHHPELVTAHRSGALGWHCRGRSVLDIRRTRAGVAVRGGVASKSGDYGPLVEHEFGAMGDDPATSAAVIAAAEAAIQARLSGDDAGHREHRFQARLAHSDMAGRLGLREMLREFPAFRPGVDKPGRGYLDFLAAGDDGRAHVVETKIGHDPMIALQALDYWVWAEAHRSELAAMLGTDPDRSARVDLVVHRDEGRPLVDRFTAAVLERLDRSVRWSSYQTLGDLDGDLAVEAVPRRRVTTGGRWAEILGRRVESAAETRGDAVRYGWYSAETEGFVSDSSPAASALIEADHAHSHLGHVRSSQRYALNLFGALDVDGVADILADWFGPMGTADLPAFEWTDETDTLRESTAERPHKTQVDVLLRGTTAEGRRVAALVEVKLTETGFGTCSHAENAPADVAQICAQPGGFGGDPDGCWQLRNRDVGMRRRYDEFLTVTPEAVTTGGCPFRRANQPMRLAALAGALEERDHDEVIVALTAPNGHVAVHRQWADATRILGSRLRVLEPSRVAEALTVRTQLELADLYGVRGRPSSPSCTRELKEALGWQLVAELVRRHPGVFTVLETHPGGGMYDCLALYVPPARAVVQLNREGSLHFEVGESMSDVWERLVQHGPEAVADRVAARIDVSDARSTGDDPGVVAMMAAIAGAVADAGWTWRNGIFDTSGYGGGPVTEWFDRFGLNLQGGGEDHGLDQPGYRYWFLVRGDVVAAALDARGRGWVDGGEFELTEDGGRGAFLGRVVSLAIQAAPEGDEPDG